MIPVDCSVKADLMGAGGSCFPNRMVLASQHAHSIMVITKV